MSDLLLRRARLSPAPPDAPPIDLRIRGGRIADIGPALAPGPEPELDAGGRTLIPGLIDLHVHGAGGADVLDASEDGLRTMARTLAGQGVTGFLATTFLSPASADEHLAVAAAAAGRRLGGARLLGLHLEGPFVNPTRRGGLPPDALQPPSHAHLDRILTRTGGALRMMTIAPEMPGAGELIARLADGGVIASFGHSDADYDQARAGLDAGIRHATHLWNAMRGVHHRDPGALVALHEAPEVTVQVIADDVHVDRRVVRWTRAMFGAERCIPITDGMRTVGLPDGTHHFGGREFRSDRGAARLTDGTLIGTSLGMLDVVHRWREYTGCTLTEAAAAASRLPALLLGLDTGVIAAGRPADLVVLDADGRAWATVVEGEVVYRRNRAEVLEC